MPSRAHRPVEETNAANSRAYRGAFVGAGQWGVAALGLGILGHFISPVYRGLTPQFKTWLQLSAMTVGGVIGAERSVRSFEFEMLAEKRRQKNQAAWEHYEAVIERERTLELQRKAKEDSRNG